MTLSMRCQHCSDSKVAESETLMDSATHRCEIARANDWLAFVSKALEIPLYFCSSQCETKWKLARKLHLRIVGSVNR